MVAMTIEIREYAQTDLPEMLEIWNEIVEEGIAFPQEEPLTLKTAVDFFGAQSFTGLAVAENRIHGLYILHPNNVGRCGHIANASYGVSSSSRGMKIGEKLVIHSLQKCAELGFRILQFNAVVKTNVGAIRLYEKLGFVKLGTIPGGFRLKNGKYEDIAPFYHMLEREACSFTAFGTSDLVR